MWTASRETRPMADNKDLVNNAMDILSDWCHEEKPGAITNERVFAMGLLHGEVLRLRELLAAPTTGGTDG